MKGLLIKDFYMIWKQAKFMLLLVLVYTVLGAFGTNMFWSVFAVLFVSMLPVTALGLDERSRWASYEAMLPYSRKEIVISKYIFGMTGAGIIIALHVILMILSQIVKGDAVQPAEVFRMFVSLFMTASFFLGTNLPIMFKLGVEKGRMWYLMSIVVMMGGGSFVVSVLNEENNTNAGTIFELANIGSIAGGLEIILFALGIALLRISVTIAVRMYEKKEL